MVRHDGENKKHADTSQTECPFLCDEIKEVFEDAQKKTGMYNAVARCEIASGDGYESDNR